MGDRDDILIANVADDARSVQIVTSRGRKTLSLAPSSFTRIPFTAKPEDPLA